MNDVLYNVTATAAWGSLAATVILGAFMCVQAAADPARRVRFAAFATVCFSISAIDFLRPELPWATYELLRLFTTPLYAASILLLLGHRARAVVATAIGIPAVGLAVWLSGHAPVATTVTFPLAFTAAAAAHARQFLRTRGYASCMLAACSAAMAASCSIYYAAVRTEDARVMVLGYANWALLNACAVLFGWTHYPRELRGVAPVRIRPAHALAVSGAILLSEVGVILGMFVFLHWPPVAYLASSIVLVASTLVLYFHHRHQLVIHTDNVSALLEERTASLRAAQELLARQNEVLEQRLAEQANELRVKGEVIDRQRRVELAAQVAGEAAHDIQNLLAPIQTYLAEIDRGPGRETAARIRRQVDQLLELNGHLLALSRRGRVEAQPFDLRELVASVLERFPGLPVRTECCGVPSGPAWVQGSFSQVSRAVANLVRNAIEAEPRRDPTVVVRCGTIATQETRRCHLGFLAPGEHAFVQVEDSGPGVPEAFRERIFEPFFSSKTGPHRSGTGLGLSIVVGVVEDHGGVVDLETGPGGTRFTLYFPSIPTPSTAPRIEEVYGNETVVVAEDDEMTHLQCVRELEEAGYSVIPARNGVELLRVLQAESADAVLLDLKMPRMGGLEALFGAIHLRPGIRVVVYTSYVTPEEATQLATLGATEVLMKPASRVELLRALRRALRGSSLYTR